MTPARRNLVVLAFLVAGLVAAGWLLRARPDGAATGSTGASGASGAASGAPSTSPSSSATVSSSPSSSGSAAATSISTVAFIGDSFTAGVGASSESKRWTTLVASGHGWTEKNFGHPQSGYASFGTQGPCAAANSCPAYPAVVSEVVAAAPQLVVISGGGNDVFLDAAQVRGQIDQTIAAVRTGLPAARIVVVNPWWDMRPVPAALATVAEDVKAAAAANNATWADTGQPITGKVDLVTSDGLQANDAGHAAMARAVEAALKLAQITK